MNPIPTSRLPFHYYLLWLVALVSLALNGYLLYTLYTARQQAGLALAQAAEALGAIQAGAIEYTVTVDETIPVALDVPVKFTVVVPIEKTIPINATVFVPVEIPLIGTRTLNVPIQTSIPIKLDVEVPIDRTIPVDASIPVRFDVPVEIKVADTALGIGLSEFQAVLQAQADQLGSGQ